MRTMAASRTTSSMIAQGSNRVAGRDAVFTARDLAEGGRCFGGCLIRWALTLDGVWRRAHYNVGPWGNLVSCAPVVYSPLGRIANPPQDAILPHYGTCPLFQPLAVKALCVTLIQQPCRLILLFRSTGNLGW